MSIPIADIFNGISAALQICKDLKSLYDSSRKDIEKIEEKEKGHFWATYINPVYSFKISWPDQRWGIVEIGETGPNLCSPIELRFRTSPVRVSQLDIGEETEFWPYVKVTIMNGAIDMQEYVKLTVERLSSFYESIGGTFIQERLSTKIESDEALIPYSVKFPNVVVWEIRKIKRFEDKMFIVTGSILEGVPYLGVVLSDLPKIMNTVTILGSKKRAKGIQTIPLKSAINRY